MNYVALIRGIGPGDPRKSNASLTKAMQQLGLNNVLPVISSGNVVFTSDISDTGRLEEMLERAWINQLGFTATTIVKSQPQLQSLMDHNPLAGIPHQSTTYQLITFFKRPTSIGFQLPYQPPNKAYRLAGVVDGSLFSITDNTVVKTPDFMAWLEKQYGKDITSRTPLTIGRIWKKMETLV